MFTALLSPYTLYSGQDMVPRAECHGWNLGPDMGPLIWPAAFPDSPWGKPVADLWRSHVRNLGAC